METSYSREEQLLLDCACVEVQAAAVARIRNRVERTLDWQRVAELAERHRVTPLVCRTLEVFCPEILRRPETAALRVRTRFIAGRTLQLTREMLSIVKMMELHNIAVVPLKGPVLAMAAFGRLSGREFADLDLLVHPKDLKQARYLLCETGYLPELALAPKQELAYLRSEHAFTYHREHDGITVELHWRLHDRYLAFPLANSDLWAKIGVESIFGTQINVLNPAQNFVYLCMHGAKHSWDRLEWISCLNALASSQPATRWPIIVAEAARLRSTRLLQLGLTLAERLNATPSIKLALTFLPPDPVVDGLAAAVWERMFATEITGSAREVYRFRFYLKAREYLRDRLHIVWSLSVRIPHPQSSSWNDTNLPSRLMFMHYFLGPLHFLKKFGVQGLRGVLRSNDQSTKTLDLEAKRRL